MEKKSKKKIKTIKKDLGNGYTEEEEIEAVNEHDDQDFEDELENEPVLTDKNYMPMMEHRFGGLIPINPTGDIFKDLEGHIYTLEVNHHGHRFLKAH